MLNEHDNFIAKLRANAIYGKDVMEPSVGRIIHVTADLSTDQTDCLAAIITRVNPDGTIHATLFAPIGPMADAAKRLPPLPRESWHDPRH